MSRRANSKIRPLWIALAIAAVVLSVGIGVVVQNTGGEPYRTIPELDLTEYLNNANSLQGNICKVRGQITQSLGYSRGKGRLFSVEVNAGKGNGKTTGDMVPILIPPKLGYLNIQKGQRYIFRLEVGDGGVLLAQDMQKTSS